MGAQELVQKESWDSHYFKKWNLWEYSDSKSLKPTGDRRTMTLGRFWSSWLWRWRWWWAISAVVRNWHSSMWVLLDTYYINFRILFPLNPTQKRKRKIKQKTFAEHSNKQIQKLSFAIYLSKFNILLVKNLLYTNWDWSFLLFWTLYFDFFLLRNIHIVSF